MGRPERGGKPVRRGHAQGAPPKTACIVALYFERESAHPIPKRRYVAPPAR
jgi:hypothetical protein